MGLLAVLLVLGCFALTCRAQTRPSASLVHPDAVALIVRWEVTSEQRYRVRYERPLYPGGISGVTIGIGYDLGHNTTDTIRSDWAMHPQVSELDVASGVMGDQARALARRMQNVRTLYPLAYEVFRTKSLVAYYRRARRAFPGFELLCDRAQGALVSLVYNRGTAMAGATRLEMRVIRDECVPRGDARCIGAQLRAMSRHWQGTKLYEGLRARRYDEASLALSCAWSPTP